MPSTDPSPVADGIAIVGIGFRFPGDLSDQDSLWKALREGRDMVGSVPPDRWSVDELAHSKRSEPGRSVTFSAGVLSRIDEFDAAFFGISPREAAWLDPQQRLLLEMSWEAMENAGVLPSSLAGSDCAVFVGISGLDYGTRGLDDLAAMSSHSMTGNTLSIAANRLSYVFDLHGPSLAVDTACSSSLVALHHACNCLRAGEASTALVGGVNMLLHPYPFVGFTKASMISADGRCKVFDAAGNGYVRSEGGAVLLLKPLAQAVADDDPIEAVILASGTNADGARKTGITIPSPAGQQELMEAVLARTGLTPDDIDFVEAHGTGTAIGDPIEANSIGNVYGRGRRQPLPLGSVKANLGHLEPASGMAGLVKTVLALKHRELPPALHLKTPNPHIDFAALNLELVTMPKQLAVPDERAPVAALNSFGFGGANAHVILQGVMREAEPAARTPPIAQPPLILSARSDAALRALAAQYSALIEEAGPAGYYDLAYATAYHRDRLERRLAVSGSRQDLAQVLAQFSKGESAAGCIQETEPPVGGRVAFVYSGNGSQWTGMGRRLLSESEDFVAYLQQVDTLLTPLAGFSIVDELLVDDSASRLDDTVVAQPLLFAIQVATTLWLRDQGVEPAAVTGHSVGEVAAAWAAGALSLEDAVRVICRRSQMQGMTRGQGRMAAVALGAEAMRDLIARADRQLDVEIAGINSPGDVTLAGPLEDLQWIRQNLLARETFFRVLDLDYAFHSRQMDSVREPLVHSLNGLAPRNAASVAFVSTVNGGLLAGSELGADYWWRNVREPVKFRDAVVALRDLGCRIFVEIGPHAILQRYIADSLKSAETPVRVLPTLKRKDDGPDRLAEAALRVQLHREVADLAPLFPVPGGRCRLPNYPWQRERHWHPRTSESAAVLERRRVHPLLGWRLSDTPLGWENTIDATVLPWLADHRVGEAIVFPGAAYLELALAAAREWLGEGSLEVEELDIVAPMVFDGDHARTLRLTLDPRDGRFQIGSRQRLSDDELTLHAAGRLLRADDHAWSRPMVGIAGVDRQLGRDALYSLAASVGLQYGPAFQGLAALSLAGERLDARIEVPEVVVPAGYLLHPALGDLCFQSLIATFAEAIADGQGAAFLPVKIGRTHWQGGSVEQFRARLTRRSARSVTADFELLDGDGNTVAWLTGCRFRAAPLRQAEAHSVASWSMIPVRAPHPQAVRKVELPKSAELFESIRAAIDPTQESRGRWFKETLPLIEALALSFAYEAAASLARQRPRDWHNALATPYGKWLLNLLCQEGLVQGNADAPVLDLQAELPSAAEIWRSLIQESPASLPQLAMIGRVGRNLPMLLANGGDPAAFLEALRAVPIAEQMFSDDPTYTGVSSAIDSALQLLCQALPVNRCLRVLEIVAGTGDPPRRLLAAQPDDSLLYVMAGIDADPAEAHPAEFAEHSNLVGACLDSSDWTLKADAALPTQFDVVILRHVLHRVPKPHALLVQLRRQMAGGARLLLAERYPDWSADFVDGLDPSWWHEADLTEGVGMVSSLMAPANWQAMLSEEAFDDCAAIEEPAAEGLAEGAYLLLATRTPDALPVAAAPAEATSWTLFADATSAATVNHLHARLESLAQQVVVRRVDAPSDEALPVAEQANNLVWCLGWNDTPDVAAARIASLTRLINEAAAQSGRLPRLWLVCRSGVVVDGLPGAREANPAQAAVWGLGRVVMNEYPGLACTLIDLAKECAGHQGAQALEWELLAPDGHSEVALTGEGRYALVAKPVECREIQGPERRFRLDFLVPGQLRNLRWMPVSERKLAPHEVEIAVGAAGLNFRDVMYVMGLLPDEAVENGFAGASLGLEFSGVVSRIGEAVRDFVPGEAVMGFGSHCFSSHVVTRADAIAPMPDAWTFEAAATVPTVFFTVFYALHHLADLQAGERVLIHGGAGGVGIAAIQLARHLGAEVFATAGSDEKRDVVHLLGADHVFDSRDLGFAERILEATDGQGVDVVLNSLAGEAIRRNLRVLRPFGRFLELGKRDFFENTPIGLRPFKDNISYFGIDADQLLTGRPQLAARLFREVMALFREGVLSPLPHRVFAADDVVDAFRVMQQARHIGKVVVNFKAPPTLRLDSAKPAALSLPAETTWVVSGGTAGFGLESARWIASRGVRNLVLLGRRGAEAPGASEALAEFAAQGVRAVAIACDVADAAAVRRTLAEVSAQFPPIKGVLHAAAHYDDRLLAKLDGDSISAVLRPKLLGAWNLHLATLDVPLDHFVLYSSVTTMIGNPGQGNYVAANAGLESLAMMRRLLGLPAHCVAWGPIADAGYLARNEAVRESLAGRMGRAPLAVADALDQLDRVLAAEAGVTTIANFEWRTLARVLPSSQAARFRWLNWNSGGSSDIEETGDIRALIAGRSPEEVAVIVQSLVVQEVAAILCIAPERIEGQRSLHELGMDSLMAVELALGLEQRFGIQLPVMMLNEAPTAEKVTTWIVGKLLGVSSDEDQGSGAVAEALARQHGEEISAEEIAQTVADARELAQGGARLTA